VTVGDAVAAIAEARARHGETFVVESGSDHYLFTFSPTGVESFYALPEEIASKGLADYLMLRRKLPDEIFRNGRHLLGRCPPRSAASLARPIRVRSTTSKGDPYQPQAIEPRSRAPGLETRGPLLVTGLGQ